MRGEGLGASRRGYGSLFRDRVDGPSVALTGWLGFLPSPPERALDMLR